MSGYPTITFFRSDGERIVLPRPADAPPHVLFDARWFDNEVGRALGLKVCPAASFTTAYVGATTEGTV